MRILLTGSNGQVGFELARSLSVLGDVVACDRSTCDLTDVAAIRRVVRDCRPDVIVNPAAYTQVDKAESNVEVVRAVNTEAPAVLAEEADALGALLVHYSTDYVFDGTKATPYVEQDSPNPVNVYGLSKLQGEVAIASRTSRHLIFRTSWVFGAFGANFAKTMLRLATERATLNVVADQLGAPTSAALLADATAHVIRQYQQCGHASRKFPYGIYHLVAGGETSWCDYARFVIAEARKLGREFKLEPDGFKAISTADYPTPARRPANSRMINRKFIDTFDLRIPAWQEGVGHMLRQILQGQK